MVNHNETASQTPAMTKRLQVRIPKQLHQDFQIACLQQGEDMTAVINNFINRYVDYSNRKGNDK